MRDKDTVRENILEILCNRCTYSNGLVATDITEVCRNCEREGDYWQVKELLDELEGVER